MSGQWQPNRVQPKTPWLTNILAEIRLSKLVEQLEPNEVEIATVYVENLIKTRPRKSLGLESIPDATGHS